MSCIAPQTWVAWQSLHPPNPTFPGNVGISDVSSLMESSWHPFLQRVFPFLNSSHTPLLSLISLLGADGVWKEQEGHHFKKGSLLWGLGSIWYFIPLSSFFSCTLLRLDNNLDLKVWFQDLPFLPPEIGQLKLELQQLAGKRDGQ